jgi:hypothetical protein
MTERTNELNAMGWNELTTQCVAWYGKKIATRLIACAMTESNGKAHSPYYQLSLTLHRYRLMNGKQSKATNTSEGLQKTFTEKRLARFEDVRMQQAENQRQHESFEVYTIARGEIEALEQETRRVEARTILSDALSGLTEKNHRALMAYIKSAKSFKTSDPVSYKAAQYALKTARLAVSIGLDDFAEGYRRLFY